MANEGKCHSPSLSLSLTISCTTYIYVCAAWCKVRCEPVGSNCGAQQDGHSGISCRCNCTFSGIFQRFLVSRFPTISPQIERAITGGGGCASSEAQGYLLQREESFSSARGILFGSLFTDTRLCRQYVYVNKTPPPEYPCSRQQFVPNDLARRKLSAFSLVASCLPFEKLNYRR